jgi:DNA invertase Pin-like site-specific DNA recombinase
MGDILGYARVSTGDRDVTGQTARLTRAGVVKVFRDIGSGCRMGQPGLEGLLAAARKGDTVAVVRLDRLGRTIAELLTTVATLMERGIALVCMDEKIDTRSADGALILRLFAAFAECERRLAAERAQGEIAAAMAHGKRRGRPPLDADKITAALKLVESGLSPAAAARQLRLGRSTIYREVSRAGIERASSPSRGA